jgi:hypothetical protein
MPSFISNPITSVSTNINTKQDICRKYNGFYPSFKPTIYSLSTYESNVGQYNVVYINGLNFFPNGTTYVNFGIYTNIPITYYSSNNISFVVPTQALFGSYNVVVVNIYNGNFSKPVQYSYPGNLNYSNVITYYLNFFTIDGNYKITSDSSYNYIITFYGNSSITFYQNITINYTVVGGGGGGGSSNDYQLATGAGGGGGGGGEVIYGMFKPQLTKLYNISIGEGGKGGLISSNTKLGLNGSNGQKSVLSGPINILANGGYGGIGQTNYPCNGGASGSGAPGGKGSLPGQTTLNKNAAFGGGGGGGTWEYTGTGGNGSLNISVPMFGSSFGAGGGGGSFNAGFGYGGNSNAGNGGSGVYLLPSDAKPYTGCGGGGGGANKGSNGGSGIIILYF